MKKIFNIDKNEIEKKNNLTKLLYSFILSMICFSIILTTLRIDAYNIIYVSILSLITIVLDNKENAKYIFKALCFGTIITLGYIISNYFTDGKYRWIIISFIVVKYVYILLNYKKFGTDKDKNTTVQNEIFSEREHDIERLGEYIQKCDTIGIIGEWGSGKTYLVDEFIRRNKEEYEVIKIETLTCKLDSIDLYIFKQLENVLWRNGIYPRYSRQIQDIMDEKGIIKQLRGVFVKGSQDKSTVVNGFCEDINKLDKTILLVCEDIDRISENYVDEVPKILDMSAKLAGNNVKVIYEYDQTKMNARGFHQEYMEKYVPYVINLTDISFMRLIENSLQEEECLNGNLTQEDFQFFKRPIYADDFLKKRFGIDFSLKFIVKRVPPRKVKEFVTEVNLALNNKVFAAEENRKIVIVFFYVKIFMRSLYEELQFEDEIQDEVRFQKKIITGDTVQSRYYSMMELVDLLTNSKINAGDLKQMFSSDENEIEEGYVADNRNKLVLLLILGFDFKELQQLYEEQHSGKKKTEHNPILDEESSMIKSIEHNKKINRLIKNLYMNGKSEYTNNQANAIFFIDDVLFAEKEEQETKWREYTERCYNGELYKDNESIFMMDADYYLSLAKAISIVIESQKYLEKRGEIKEQFIDFWMKHSDNKKIILETVKIFELIDPDDHDRKSFIKAVTYFNTLEINGNMNQEDVYIKFIGNYIKIAYRLGYIYDNRVCYLVGELHPKKDKNDKTLEKRLEQIQEIFQKEIDEKSYPEETRSEFELVNEFLKKNIEIVKTERKFQQDEYGAHITKMEDKENKVYEELKNMPGSREAFKVKLHEEFRKENISLREYRELLKMI